ncbi:hypothetical protein JXQ70_08820 [bacterium]|nr:hypothetical protein [bacterium]
MNTSYAFSVHVLVIIICFSLIIMTNAVLPVSADQLLLSGNVTNGPGRPAGTFSVGPTGDYSSLTEAFSDINTEGLQGPIMLELQATYVSSVETFPLKTGRLYLSSEVNTVTIRPASDASNLSISSDNAETTFDINGDSYGCSYLIIDGRPGGSGSVKHLTIENTGTGSAVRFMNGAILNHLTYVTLRGITTATDTGVVVFGGSIGPTGNSANTLDQCDIREGATTPRYGIYSEGTSALANTGNVINNCNIYNYFIADSDDAGIYVSTESTDWIISGNSFFQEAIREAQAKGTHYGIYINNTNGNAFQVNGNYIGGSASGAGGSPWKVTNIFDNRFVGIQLNVGTVTPSSVQGNTVSNFDWYWSSTTTATTPPGIWCGIYIQAGNVAVGTLTGNTIGGISGTQSILVQNGYTGRYSYGIGSSSNGEVSISNNMISSISVVGAESDISSCFTGIHVTAGNNTISANTIGSLSTPGSISAGVSTSSTGQSLNGIISQSSTGATISDNIIAHMINAYDNTNSAGQVRGIVTTSGVNVITDNVIRDLSTTSRSSGSNATSSVLGICQTSTGVGQTISRNTIHSIANVTLSSAAVKIAGIYFAGGTASLISHNEVHSLMLSTTNTGAYLYGLMLNGGSALVANNMVRLGLDATGVDMTVNYALRGINDQSGLNSIVFNTVYLGGTDIQAGSTNTYAFYSAITGTTSRSYMNNLLVNCRSNGAGTGRHVAAYYGGTLPAPIGLLSDNNLYVASGTGRAFVQNGSKFYTSLYLWQVASWLDGESLATIGPEFVNLVNPTGTSSDLDLHVQTPTAIEGTGYDIVEILDDYDFQTRLDLSPVDIGADAGNFTGVDIRPPTIIYLPLDDTVSLDDPVLSNVTIIDDSGVDTAPGSKPRIYYKRSTDPNIYNDNTNATEGWKYTETPDSTSPFTFTIEYDRLYEGTISYETVIKYFIVAQDMADPVNVAINIGEFAAVQSSVALDTTAFPIAEPISYFTLYQPLSGVKTVCASGCDYETLTFTNGAFDMINRGALVGNLELQIAGDLTTNETGLIPLNAPREIPIGSYTLKIYPTGAARVISSTATATAGFIRLNAADRVTFDGSLNGSGLDRSLTINQMSSSGSGAVIWLHNLSGEYDGAENNTIKNLNIVGNSNTTTLFGIGLGNAGNPSLSSVGRNNNNNLIGNNAISKVRYGIYCKGASSSIKNIGNIITQNLINAAYPDNVARGGILVGYEEGLEISQNRIDGINMAGTVDVFGISLGLTAISPTTFTGQEVSNATVVRNSIGSVVNTGGNSAVGIASAVSDSGITLIANNVIFGVGANPRITSTPELTAGILIGGGEATYQVYHNSVAMSGSFSEVDVNPVFALAIGGTTTNPSVDTYNNIFYNTQDNDPGLSVSIGLQANSSQLTNFLSDYNDLYVASGSQYYIGKIESLDKYYGYNTIFPDLISWQTAVSQDVNSLSLDPLFSSLTDLRPADISPVLQAGTPLAEVTIDIDGYPRDPANPSIGAYETASTVWIDVESTSLDYPMDGGSVQVNVSFNPLATFTNTGSIEVIDVPVRFRIIGPAPASDEIYNQTEIIPSLEISDFEQVSFPATMISNSGVYTMFASVELTGDQQPNNDEISGSFTVSAGFTIDVSTISLDDPLVNETKTAGVIFEPQATFFNAGLTSLTDVPVRFRISGPEPSTTVVYNQTSVVPTLNTGFTQQVTFTSVTSTTFNQAGTYTMEALAEQPGDEQPNNDLLSGTFFINVVGTIGSSAQDYLYLTKVSNSPVSFDLIWGDSCGEAQTDYALYEGLLGSWFSHTSIVCTTGNELFFNDYFPEIGNYYYLVVPLSETLEGSYGQDSIGIERPVGSDVCRTEQNTAACAEP